MLRGYLNSSVQRVCSTVGRYGRQRDALRVDLQCPGERPARLLETSHPHQPVRRLRDKGTDVQGQERGQQANRKQTAPADIGCRKGRQQGAEQKTRRQHRRGQPGQPAALGGRHEFLNYRDVDRIHAGYPETDEQPADHQVDPGVLGGESHRPGGDRGIQHSADHRLAPADLVGHPAPDDRAERRSDARRQQDQPRFPKGQVPVFDDKRQDKGNQSKVEEVEHVADRGGARNLPLISRQLSLLIE